MSVGDGLPDRLVACLSSQTSARVLTVVPAVAVLLPGTGSGVGELTTTLLVSTVPGLSDGSTRTVSWTVAVWLGCSVPTAHSTLAVCTSVHTVWPLLLTPDTNVTPAGRVSVSSTEVAVDGPPFVAVMVHVRRLPAMTGSGESVLVTRRSAEAVTPVGTLTRLLALSGSAVVLDTTASLTRIVPGGTSGATVPLTVTTALAPALRLPRLHVRSCPVGWPYVHVPTVVDTDTKVTPVGSRSVTTAPTARDGPLFVTVTTYWTGVPATTEVGPVFVTWRSAEPVKTTLPVAWLLAVTGSGVGLDTVATSLTSATSAAVTRTRTVVRPPAGSVPRLHVIVIAVAGPAVVGAHVPEGVTVTPVTENGVLEVRTSVSVTSTASDGPRLSTWMSQKASVPAGAVVSGLQTL